MAIHNGTATLKDSLEVSTKLSTFLPQEQELCPLVSTQMYWKFISIYPHINLHMNVYSSFIHNWQYLKAAKMSFNRWMNKNCATHSDILLFSPKKNELSRFEDTWKKHNCILLSEKWQYENAIDYLVSTIWHLEKAKQQRPLKESMVAWVWRGEMEE